MIRSVCVLALAILPLAAAGSRQETAGQQPQPSSTSAEVAGEAATPADADEPASSVGGPPEDRASGDGEPSAVAKPDPTKQDDTNQADDRGNTDRKDEKPLLLDDEPLLLDDEEKPAGPVADNSRCHVCHLNYVQEELAVGHARANIGCAKCHGESDAHIADESWASGGNGTPPEIMYPREKIDPACGECHQQHDVPATEVIARWLQRRPANASQTSVVCTDCHGQHRLTERTCKWK